MNRVYHPAMSDRPTDRPEHLTVAQTADRLGISEDAVRSRIKRGTLRSVRDGGVVHVLLDADRPTTSQPTGETTDQPTASAIDPRDELIAVLREQLSAEREANRENRRLLAAVLERMPALEASEGQRPAEHQDMEPHEAREDGSGEPPGASPAPEPRPTVWGRLRAIWRGPR